MEKFQAWHVEHEAAEAKKRDEARRSRFKQRSGGNFQRRPFAPKKEEGGEAPAGE
jgi:hypothetical protein